MNFVQVMKYFNDWKEARLRKKKVESKSHLHAVTKEECDIVTKEEIDHLRAHVHRSRRSKSCGDLTKVGISKSMMNLVCLPHAAVQCPIGGCNQMVGVTAMLSHNLRDHCSNYDEQCCSVYNGKQSLLMLDPSQLKFRQNQSLAMLIYSSDDETAVRLPISHGICLQNNFVPKPYDHLERHLPVMVMVCLTSWSALLRDKQLEAIHTDAENRSQHMLVLWLASMHTTKPLWGTMTAFDQSMSTSRSTILKVRDLNASQNPSEFMMSERSIIRLSRPEIDLLSQQGEGNIYLEIILNEYK